MGLLLEDSVVKIYFLLLWSNKWGNSIYPIFIRLPNQYVVETGSNYVLFSAHPGARTARDGQPVYAGHDTWQGCAFSIRGSEPGYPNLLESTGYDINPVTGQGTVVDPLGAHGYNCRHSHRVWDKRLKNPWRDDSFCLGVSFCLDAGYLRGSGCPYSRYLRSPGCVDGFWTTLCKTQMK